jgi:hypothetical protein
MRISASASPTSTYRAALRQRLESGLGTPALPDAESLDRLRGLGYVE